MGKTYKPRLRNEHSTAKDQRQSQSTIRHVDLQEFTCKFCPKTFNRLQNLTQHRLTHSGERRLACIFCGKMFRLRSHLNLHLLVHTQERPYDCKFCGKEFNKPDNVNRHITTHTGEKRHKCELCEKHFSTTEDRNRHIRSHTLEKPYKCEICSRRFTQSNSYKRHRYRFHDSSSGRNLHNCIFCKKWMFRKDEYIHHIGSHINERPYNCRFCCREYVSNPMRKYHERRYCKEGCTLENGPSTFGCLFCGKKFNRKVDLENHFRIHTRERPFECTTCNKWFNTSSYLHKHAKNHSGVMP